MCFVILFFQKWLVDWACDYTHDEISNLDNRIRLSQANHRILICRPCFSQVLLQWLNASMVWLGRHNTCRFWPTWTLGIAHWTLVNRHHSALFSFVPISLGPPHPGGNSICLSRLECRTRWRSWSSTSCDVIDLTKPFFQKLNSTFKKKNINRYWQKTFKFCESPSSVFRILSYEANSQWFKLAPQPSYLLHVHLFLLL